MSIKAQKVSEALRTVTFRFLDDDVTVRYRLGRINQELAEMAKPNGDGEERGAIGKIIEHVLVEWDVLDEDGQALPPTQATIERYELPTPFLSAVLTAVTDDAQPGKLRKTHSSNGTR